MKKLIYILFVCLLTGSAVVFAQKTISKKDSTQATFVERMPFYTDGDEGIFKFIEESRKLSAPNRSAGDKSTKSFVKFTINKDGIAEGFQLAKINKDGAKYDDEALRIMKALPQKWNAGIKNNKSIGTDYTIPIKFKLD